MKQNLGIFSLVASKVDKKPASSPEKTIIYLSGLAGIVGSMRFKIDATFLAAYADEIFVFSKFLIGIAFTGLLLIIFTSWKNGKISIKRQMFLAACTLFFLPTFLANTYFPAVTSYAFAHGLQYWLFMGFLAYGNQKSIRKGAYKLALLGTLTVGGWSLIYFSRIADLWGPWASAIGGLGFGVTMAHFIVDADAWRMRESFQRNYISTRLF